MPYSYFPSGEPNSRSLIETIFVFIDESGDLQKPPQGTSHFVLCALATKTPIESAAEVFKLRYTLLTQGWTLPAFHASENLRVIRDQFRQLVDSLDNIHFDVRVVRKEEVKDLAWNASQIYGRCILRLLDSIMSPIFKLAIRLRGPFFKNLSVEKKLICPYFNIVGLCG